MKSFNSENQATDYFDIRNLDDKRIVDFEGLDSINNDSRKEGIIFSLSFAISDIVLLHIQHRKLDAKYIERFSYKYWLSCQSLKAFNIQPPKIYLFIRDASVDQKLNDEEVYASQKNSVDKFCRLVNENLQMFKEF